MGLIRCPECGYEVSDKAVACVKCGFPLAEYVRKREKTCIVDGVSTDLSYILDAKTDEERCMAGVIFKKFTGCTAKQANEVVRDIQIKQQIPQEIKTKGVIEDIFHAPSGVEIIPKKYER